MSTENHSPAITEADVAAFLKSYIGQQVNGRPIHAVTFCASTYADENMAGEAWMSVTLHAVDHEGVRHCDSGSNIESAMKVLANRIKPAPAPEERAKALREKAAHLLAQAMNLEAAAVKEEAK